MSGLVAYTLLPKGNIAYVQIQEVHKNVGQLDEGFKAL